jgi:hypothetical protein
MTNPTAGKRCWSGRTNALQQLTGAIHCGFYAKIVPDIVFLIFHFNTNLLHKGNG